MKKIYLFLLLVFPFVTFAQNNWDGDNGTGVLSNCTNWYSNSCPGTWNSSTDLNFSYNNSNHTTLTQDIGWKDVRAIFFNSTYTGSVNLSGSTGFNFWYKIENQTANTQTVSIPTSAKGSGFELNAVNGNLVISGVVYNDNNVNGNIYNSNSKSTILSNYIVGNSSVKLYVKNTAYGILQINCNMPTLSASSFANGITVERGELWFNSGAAINGGTLQIGNGDANVCKLYINANGGTTVSNAITVPTSSTNVYIGGLGTSGTNVYSGAITLNNAATFENYGGGTLDFQGNISGSNAVTLARANASGTTTIKYSTNTKSYTGLTTINGNTTLQIAVANALPSSNNITVNSGGTLKISANQTIANLNLSAGGNLTVDAGSTLTITGTYTPGAGTINNLGTIVLNGSAAQTFPGSSTTVNNGTANTLTNLTINNSNGVTLNKDLIVSGALTLTAGTFNVNGQTLTLNGSISGAGSLDATSTNSRVVLVGTSTVPSQLGGAVSNLTINRSGGVTMGSNLLVNDDLTFTTGTLSLNGSELTLNGTLTGMSASNCFVGSNTSKLVIASANISVGTIYFDQSTSADVTTTNGTNALQNFEMTGANGDVTLGNKLNLFDKLTVQNGTLNTGGYLVLRSTATNTAYVDQVVGGTINGQVTVERYFHKAHRGWRMVTAPVTYNGIISNDNDKVYKNWQSNFGYSSNYGTIITANVTPSGSNGIDTISNSSNLLTYNTSGSGSWNLITNTKTETMSGSTATAANKGFFLFLRGDRTVPVGLATTWAQTTLAAKGLLQSGTQTFNYGGTGASWIVGNPYASPIDMSTVSMSNCGSTCYVWDPNLTGITSASPGAYNSFDMSNWNAAPIGGGNMNKYFQSGQAFLVKPSTGASITFTESDKTTSAHNSTYTNGSQTNTTDVFNVILYAIQPDGSKTNVDGVRAKFGTNYSDAVDGNDGLKIAGGIENISLERNGKSLVLEARPFITTADSLFMKMTNMVTGSNYQFIINPINFDASVSSCKIVDNFLQTETSVNLTGITVYPFSITSATGSNAANRFSFIFNGTGVLPANALTINAYKKETNVIVNWEAMQECGVKKYEIEKSTSANEFKKIAEIAAKNCNTTNSYSITDSKPATINYYRIKSVYENNTEKYSAIVKVEMNAKDIKGISIYPNPVKDNTINISFNAITEGKSTINVIDITGKIVYSTSTVNYSSNSSMLLNINQNLIPGNYNLQIIDAAGNKYSQSFIKVK